MEVYQLALKLSDLSWELYEGLDWNDKKVMGNQFIEAIDSVGANIVEGYSRYHYLDKIKFYYISRGSLSEACNHWLLLLHKRKRIDKKSYDQVFKLFKEIEIKLNNFISATFKSKDKSKK